MEQSESNLKLAFPNEILFIIFRFCDIKTLKKMKYIVIFKNIVKEIDKYIVKRNNEIEDRNFWKLLYYNKFRTKLINCIENSELGLRLDSERWSAKMIDCTNMCIQLNDEMIKQISQKVKLERIMINNYQACDKLEYFYEEYENNYKDKWMLFVKKDESLIWYNPNIIKYN